jgi:hypothetical protein
MSFFENLAFLMGGEEQIPNQFRTSLAEYNDMASSFSAMADRPEMAFAAPTAAEARSSMVSQSPVTETANNPAPRKGFLGLAAPTFTNNFNQADPNTITTSGGGGLYGGDVNFNPSASAYGSIDPSMYLGDKRKGASNLSAAVQRAQYQDYLNRFAPVENYLVGQVNGRNTKDLGFDLARANQSVMSAGANMQGQQERAMGRFGLQYRGPSMADSNEITGGRVAAMNQARMADEERALSLVSGSGRTAGGQ